MRRLTELTFLLSAFAWLACGTPPDPGPLSQRLVDDFEPAMITGSPSEPELLPRAEWRFTEASDPLGWEAIQGVEGLAVRNGCLTGRTRDELPILRARRPGDEEGADSLQEVRVRLRVSAGTTIAAHFVGVRPAPLDDLQARKLFWAAETPVIADGKMRTYTFSPTVSVPSSGVRDVYLRPSNVAGADFEIESIRLVFQREFLAEKSSGVGWHGLGASFREAVTARSPETVRWPLVLPQRPRLELGLGTLDPQPVTFRIALETATGGEVLAERTLTTPNRWDDVFFDLDSHAGEAVTVVLSLDGPAGTPGLWGAPSVRRRVDPAATWDGEVQGVILLLSDTLRPDDLGFYGYERATMPHLGELAGTGVTFRDAYSHAPWTRVSVPSLVTSLHPLSHNLRSFDQRLPSSAVTLAEVYRGAGWTTAAYSTVPHTDHSANMHQGYETLRVPEGKDSYFSKTARDFVDHFLPWLEHHRDERFFVFLHVFDPHFPYQPRPPFDTMWTDPAQAREQQQQLLKVMGAVADPLKGAQGQAKREEMERAGVDPEPYLAARRGQYDGSIRAMDEDFGRIFERFRELGLDDRILVAFTSDHGEEFLDHDWMGHGHSLYRELIHVPLVLWRPGLLPSGLVVDEPVQHLDVLPTLLELSGLPVPETARGRSLLPLLSGGEGWREQPIVSERPAASHPMTPPPKEYSSTSILFEGWKLIRHGEGRGEREEYELYDHRSDPGDTRDLAAERPEVVERLAGLLEAWRRDAEAHQLKSDDGLGQSVSQEELERLRSLGYIQ